MRGKVIIELTAEEVELILTSLTIIPPVGFQGISVKLTTKLRMAVDMHEAAEKEYGEGVPL